MKQRVVVTGIGVVSCVGLGVEQFASALQAGVAGAAPVTMFDSAGFDHDLVCEVKSFDAEQYVRNQPLDALGRSARFAVAASRMAVEDAGLAEARLVDGLVPSIFGTTDGESQPFEQFGRVLYQSGPKAVDIDLLHRIPAQQIAIAVAREFGLAGEALTISTACAAGNYALGAGYDLISLGETDIALCGGSDSICRKTFAGFYRLGTMAPERCQPFDVNRHGMMVGEGSAVLILESLDSAQRRGARIYAELLGYAVNCDAEHMVSPNADSIAACMRMAHQRSGVEAASVDFISMHGTGTKANDITEVAAVKAVFGDYPPPVTSIKSSLGHAMGAASVLGAAACCLAIERNFLAPTIHLEQKDLACDVDVVANHSRAAAPDIVQNNAFAFGGNNAITLFKRVGSGSQDRRPS